MIYKDASLGNPVQIAVVRMLLLKDQEFVLPPSLSSTAEDASKESMEMLDSRPGKSASEMLRNFCKWQRVFNDPDDASPLHHDTALLLTRFVALYPLLFCHKLTPDLIRFIVLLSLEQRKHLPQSSDAKV